MTPTHGHVNPCRRANGVFAVEFALILAVSLALFLPMAEFFRLSMYDQALARVTNLGVRAAAADPNNCETAIEDAFHADSLALWLLDQNSNGLIEISAGAADWPVVSSGVEAHVNVSSDADLYDGSDWEIVGACGPPGSWISLRSRIVVQPGFGALRLVWPDGFRRQQQSWARNQG